VACLLVLAGCASAERQQGRAQGPMEVVVENTRPSGAAVSIQIVSSTGERTLLGAVAPLNTETFRVTLSQDWSYRLVAQTPEGGRIVSQSFALAPGEEVHWTLPFNTLATG
jgi:hypothetical protein